MSVSDQEFLKKLGINQAELGRLVRTSRQAVNIGVNKEETYLNINRLLLLHDALFAKGDRRSLAVKELIETAYGIKVDHTKPHTISGSPDQFPTEAKEIWFLTEYPLELEKPIQVSLMGKHFSDSGNTFVYVVGTTTTARRLTQRLSYEVSAIRAREGQTARIHIVTCNVVEMMPSCIVFDPLGEAKGYVRTVSGHFVELPVEEVGRIVSTLQQAGIRVEKDKILPDRLGGRSVIFDEIYFQHIHTF